jgi:hypothetical protein
MAALRLHHPDGRIDTLPMPEGARTLPALAFRDRFTAAEELAITTAAMSQPAIRVFLDRSTAAAEINLDDPRIVAGIDALVAAGLLAPARRAAILA